MIIRHNIAGLNAQRKLNENSRNSAKSTENLSSGLRINRAGDDAAGLAISEKMRGQIRGLAQAQQNVQDGISLIQTAESGLGEISNPHLQRLRELAVQAASDTLTESDRAQIQLEVEQIKKGINDIANNTEFNTINLLNRPADSGNTGGTSVIDGSEKQLTLTAEYDTQPSWSNGKIAFNRGSDVYIMKDDGASQSVLISGASQAAISNDGSKVAYVRQDNNLYYANIDGTGEIQLTTTGDVNSDSTFGSRVSWNPVGDHVYFQSRDGIERINISDNSRAVVIADSTSSFPSITPDGNQLVYQKADGIYIASSDGSNSLRLIDSGSNPVISPDGTKIAFSAFSPKTMDNEIYIMDIDGNNVSDITGSMSTANSHNHNIFPMWSPDGKYIAFHSDNVADPSTSGDIWSVEVSISKNTSEDTTDRELVIQTGANSAQSIKVMLTDARTSALGVDDVSLLTQKDANKSIETIDNAIQKISSERSRFGSYNNRLDHTIDRLGVSAENLTAAESRVRDSDMAKEMINQTKNTILSQAAQAMLAQANQTPQSVLQLLR